ncbi:MAG: response regulator transcription factor [Chloroflexi bacterium]|nr:MAG: response regulator transcription factor [Chloroflexota bacterium]
MTVESPVVTEPHIRLLIVDDHPAVRKGLTSLLNNEPDMEVIAAVGSGEEAVAAARTTTPDVVLMDVSMPGMGGIEATRQLASAHPGLRVVMLTSFGGHKRLHTALENGAVGYLVKDATPQEILRTLRYVARF